MANNVFRSYCSFIFWNCSLNHEIHHVIITSPLCNSSDGIEFSCMTRYVCIPMPLFNARAYVYALPHTHFLTAMPLDQPQSCDFEGSSAQLRPEFIFPCEGRSMHINPAIQQHLITLLTASVAIQSSCLHAEGAVYIYLADDGVQCVHANVLWPRCRFYHDCFSL